MKSLYLRIYATVVVVLLLFALVSGWIVERHLDEERARNEQVASDRLGAWAELLGNSLPGADTPAEVQLAGAARLVAAPARAARARRRAAAQRIGASESFERRSARRRRAAVLVQARRRPHAVDDAPGPAPGRRPPRRAGGEARAGRRARGPGGEDAAAGGRRRRGRCCAPGLPRGAGLAIVLVVLFLAVAAGAYPVVRRLTRRLEALKRGVEQFGAGALDHRVAISGADEVAAVAASFNVAAARVEALVQSHRSLLANASHELRSPLARMKMAVSMLDEATPAAARDAQARDRQPTSPSSTAWSRRCCWRAGSTPPRTALAPRPGRPARARRRGGGARRRARRERARRPRRRRRAAAAPRRPQPARERAALRRRRDRDRPRPRQRCAGAIPSRSRSAIAARACPRRCASASSSRSFACPATPSRPAASASAWRSSSRSPSATAAACAARRVRRRQQVRDRSAGRLAWHFNRGLHQGCSRPNPSLREGGAGSVRSRFAPRRLAAARRARCGQAMPAIGEADASPSTRSRVRRASTPG